MSGYAHIFRLGTRTGTHGGTLDEYQFTYNMGANSWARTFDDLGALSEFLRSNVGLTHTRTDEAVSLLRQAGKITIAEVEIPEHLAPALGLEQMPSDY